MGRKKCFDEDEVLDRAMDAFWCKGYEATSVQELLDRMGINRGSFYDTFGDKRSLFLAAIDRYNDRLICRMQERLDAPGPAKKAIVDTLVDVAEHAAADAQRRGCMVTNSLVELAPRDPEAAERAVECLRRMEEAFHGAIVRARSDGGISTRHSPRALARFLTNTCQGMLVMSKTAPDEAALRDVVSVVVSALE